MGPATGPQVHVTRPKRSEGVEGSGHRSVPTHLSPCSFAMPSSYSILVASNYGGHLPQLFYLQEPTRALEKGCPSPGGAVTKSDVFDVTGLHGRCSNRQSKFIWSRPFNTVHGTRVGCCTNERRVLSTESPGLEF